MKQLTCEMCGGTDLVKDGGVFVCQTCGCKYSVEEAKKMMVEGVVQVEGTVKVDDSSKISNFLKMARHAHEANNEKEAESYCNKIIEIDAQNAEAWLLKGLAAGWQSTGANDRISEAIECFNNAVDNASGDNEKDIKSKVAEETSKLTLAMIQLHCNCFEKHPSSSNRDDVKLALLSAMQNSLSLILKCGVKPSEFRERAASIVSNSVVDAWNEIVLPDYQNSEHVTKFEWERFTERGDSCIDLLKAAIDFYDGDGEADLHRYASCIKIQKSLIPSHSVKWTQYGYVGEWEFTDSAKQARQDKIDTWRNVISSSPAVTSIKDKFEKITSTQSFKQYIDDRIAWFELKRNSDSSQKSLFMTSRRKAEAKETQEKIDTLFAKLKAYENGEEFQELSDLSEKAKQYCLEYKIKINGSYSEGIGTLKLFLISFLECNANALVQSFGNGKPIKCLSMLQVYIVASALSKYKVRYSIG